MLTNSLDEAQRKVTHRCSPCMAVVAGASLGMSDCDYACCPVHDHWASLRLPPMNHPRLCYHNLMPCRGACPFPLQVESYFFDMRRQLWEYDQVLNTQRDKVYGERRRALESDDLSAQMVEYAERTVDDILEVKSVDGLQ